MKANHIYVLDQAARAQLHEIDAEIKHRRETGNVTEKWCMHSHAYLAHLANTLEEALEALATMPSE